MSENSEEKFEELVLYVARKSEDDESFGATKLNKILFFSDFIAYGKLGQSITGQEYQKLAKGPAPRRLLPIQKRMHETGDCAIQERERYGMPQKRLIALREPDLSRFTGEEIAIVDSVIEHLGKLNATDVSEMSHGFIGWDVVALGEVIPYQTVFISRRELTQSEKDYPLTWK